MSTPSITTHWTNIKYIQALRAHREVIMQVKNSRAAAIAAHHQSKVCRKHCETLTRDLIVSRKSLEAAEKFLGVPSVVEEAAIWVNNIVAAEADFSAVDAYDASLCDGCDLVLDVEGEAPPLLPTLSAVGGDRAPDCPGAPRKTPLSVNYTQTPMLERWLDDSVGGGPGPGPALHQTLVPDYYPKRRIKFTDETPSNHYNLRPRTK